ncbi:MAG: hypothetical protein J5716_04300 [Alphaproteobacteria bacterium]|nr:hypothetical protein [Alphaproteobacteria bacterium]
MTVSTTTNKVFYTGNGVATSFAIPFPFLEETYLKVYQLLNSVQTERTDWTISNGNLIFTTAPENGAQIAIMRKVPLTQETDYRENEVLPAETLERNFDKLTMLVQQLKEQADRAVTMDIFDNTDAANLIPSIRQAVSDCAAAVETTRDNIATSAGHVETASQKAQNAATSATNAATSELNAAASELNVSTMLGTKANLDADNFSADGKKAVVGLCVPDYGAGTNVASSVIATSGTGYKPTKDGVLFLFGTSLNGYANTLYIYKNGTQVSVQTIGINGNGGASQGDLRVIPLNKEYSYRAQGFYNSTAAYFYPYMGA